MRANAHLIRCVVVHVVIISIPEASSWIIQMFGLVQMRHQANIEVCRPCHAHASGRFFANLLVVDDGVTFRTAAVGIWRAEEMLVSLANRSANLDVAWRRCTFVIEEIADVLSIARVTSGLKATIGTFVHQVRVCHLKVQVHNGGIRQLSRLLALVALGYVGVVGQAVVRKIHSELVVPLAILGSGLDLRLILLALLDQVTMWIHGLLLSNDS